MIANFFQPAIGKSEMGRRLEVGCSTIIAKDTLGRVSSASDFFQPAVGKSIPGILFLLSYAKLLVIAAHGGDVQENLFYIVYTIRERLTRD